MERPIDRKAHGPTALSSPWLLGFSRNTEAVSVFPPFGAYALTAGTLSKPEEM